MKILTLSSLSFAFLLASSGCALLDGSNSGGDGDGDGDGAGARPGFGNGPNAGDGDGDTPVAGVNCSSLCQQQAQCIAETDAATCTSECESSRQQAESSGCGNEYAALLRCIDPCDVASVSACGALVDSYVACMSGDPVGTGGAGSGGGPFGGTGGVVVGTGGVLVSSGGAPVGIGGSPITNGPASDFAFDGLGATQSGWYGYLFTVADALGGYINPAEGDPFYGAAVCADGYTAADWAGFGLIGFNIAQSIDPETLAGGDANEIIPGGTGVYVSVQNNAGSQLRVQIQDNSGNSWCAPVPVSGTGTIPWGVFNSTCWDGAGAPYTGQPISQVMVQAPASTNLSPTAFDFCIISLDLAP